MLYVYCRVSTFEQGTKTSIEDQEAACTVFGRMQGLTAFDIQVYRDVGVSGSTKLNTRPEGAKMLAAAQRDDTIVAAKMDRLFRSSIDALETAEALKKRGVHLVLLDMGTQSVMGDGPAKLFFSMLAAFAEFERGRLVERIMAGKAAKAAKGGFTGGRTPYGMRKVGSGPTARLEPDPEQQRHFDLIRERMKLYGRWWSPSKTRKWFTQQGLFSRTGQPYTSKQIERMGDIVRRQDAQQGSGAAGDQGRVSTLQ
jgi:putative DNA-invertase from lambdoid prophage Rac